METRKTWARMTFYVTIAVIGMLILPYLPLPFMPAWTATVSYGYSGYRGDADGDEDNGEPPEPENYIDPNQDKTARDPETPWVSITILKGAVSKPVEVRVYETGWPEDVTPPPSTLKLVDSPFFLGVWATGEGRTVCEFNFPIEIEVGYAGKAVSESEERRLAFYTYDPVDKIWIKLHSVVDLYHDIVKARVRRLKCIELDTGNALLALFVYEPYSIEQTVDSEGAATISWAEKGVSLRVPPGTVDVGSFFDMTSSSPADVPPAGSSLKLGSTIVHVQAWDDTDGEISKLSQPISIDTDYSPDDLAEAGSKANLTIATLKDGVWVDAEDLGYTVTRGENQITVDTDRLGVFALAIKDH
jgi:hypothetical protein